MKKNPLLFGTLLTIALVAGFFSWRRGFAALGRRIQRRGSHGGNGRDASGFMGATGHHPSLEEIARLAQVYWEEEGHPEGRAHAHWRRAEEELRHHLL